MKKLIYRPEAAADIVEATSWYDRQRPGLGEKFLTEVNNTARHIASQPMLYQIIRRDTRRALVKRFPYGLYFRLLGDTVVVVACFHTSRNPKTPQSRT